MFKINTIIMCVIIFIGISAVVGYSALIIGSRSEQDYRNSVIDDIDVSIYDKNR